MNEGDDMHSFYRFYRIVNNDEPAGVSSPDQQEIRRQGAMLMYLHPDMGYMVEILEDSTWTGFMTLNDFMNFVSK